MIDRSKTSPGELQANALSGPGRISAIEELHHRAERLETAIRLLDEVCRENERLFGNRASSHYRSDVFARINALRGPGPDSAKIQEDLGELTERERRQWDALFSATLALLAHQWVGGDRIPWERFTARAATMADLGILALRRYRDGDGKGEKYCGEVLGL